VVTALASRLAILFISPLSGRGGRFLRAFGEPPQRIRRKARASLYALRNPEPDRVDNRSLP
jgi:hypothetical protein